MRGRTLDLAAAQISGVSRRPSLAVLGQGSWSGRQGVGLSQDISGRDHRGRANMEAWHELRAG